MRCRGGGELRLQSIDRTPCVLGVAARVATTGQITPPGHDRAPKLIIPRLRVARHARQRLAPDRVVRAHLVSRFEEHVRAMEDRHRAVGRRIEREPTADRRSGFDRTPGGRDRFPVLATAIEGQRKAPESEHVGQQVASTELEGAPVVGERLRELAEQHEVLGEVQVHRRDRDRFERPRQGELATGQVIGQACRGRDRRREGPPVLDDRAPRMARARLQHGEMERDPIGVVVGIESSERLERDDRFLDPPFFDAPTLALPRCEREGEKARAHRALVYRNGWGRARPRRCDTASARIRCRP